MKKASLIIMIIFYLLAGFNHFRNPEAYCRIIPPYFPDHVLINSIAGIAEILFALLLFIPATKKFACYAIIVMLIAFIPAHIYMLKTGFCVMGYCAPKWVLWARLLALQPLLVFWAWGNRK